VKDCPHYHRRLIAQDDVLEFVECLDCGEILEDEPKPATKPEAESLSDA
jgi:hypothetical protein